MPTMDENNKVERRKICCQKWDEKEWQCMRRTWSMGKEKPKKDKIMKKLQLLRNFSKLSLMCASNL